MMMLFQRLLNNLNRGAKVNFGPNHNPSRKFSICYWRLLYNDVKIWFLKAIVNIHIFDIIFLVLDQRISRLHHFLEWQRFGCLCFSLWRSDYLSNIRRWDMSMYVKHCHLLRDFWINHLNNKHWSKKRSEISIFLYRSIS